jgi:hypothetical protein
LLLGAAPFDRAKRKGAVLELSFVDSTLSRAVLDFSFDVDFTPNPSSITGDPVLHKNCNYSTANPLDLSPILVSPD